MYCLMEWRYDDFVGIRALDAEALHHGNCVPTYRISRSHMFTAQISEWRPSFGKPKSSLNRRNHELLVLSISRHRPMLKQEELDLESPS